MIKNIDQQLKKYASENELALKNTIKKNNKTFCHK